MPSSNALTTLECIGKQLDSMRSSEGTGSLGSLTSELLEDFYRENSGFFGAMLTKPVEVSIAKLADNGREMTDADADTIEKYGIYEENHGIYKKKISAIGRGL